MCSNTYSWTKEKRSGKINFLKFKGIYNCCTYCRVFLLQNISVSVLALGVLTLNLDAEAQEYCQAHHQELHKTDSLNSFIDTSVQFSCSVVSDSSQPCELQHARPPCPSPTPGVHSNSSPIESVMPSNHLILCQPLLLMPSIFPRIRVFPSESAFRIKWPKYWGFGLNISPSNECSGLISFRMDWLDLLAV